MARIHQGRGNKRGFAGTAKEKEIKKVAYGCKGNVRNGPGKSKKLEGGKKKRRPERKTKKTEVGGTEEDRDGSGVVGKRRVPRFTSGKNGNGEAKFMRGGLIFGRKKTFPKRGVES